MLTLEWRKSSCSNGQASCLEARLDTPATVAIRDSKNPTGPQLAVAPAAWSTFTTSIKHGKFDLLEPA
jgi:hypothetical protein